MAIFSMKTARRYANWEQEMSWSGISLRIPCLVTDHPSLTVKWGGIGTVLVYLATLVCQILLVNMLIAMMNEAFLSIYEAQEANYNNQQSTNYLEIVDGGDVK